MGGCFYIRFATRNRCIRSNVTGVRASSNEHRARFAARSWKIALLQRVRSAEETRESQTLANLDSNADFFPHKECLLYVDPSSDGDRDIPADVDRCMMIRSRAFHVLLRECTPGQAAAVAAAAVVRRTFRLGHE